METGHDLRPSAEAAVAFLISESGPGSAATAPTLAPIERIRRNLDELLDRI